VHGGLGEREWPDGPDLRRLSRRVTGGARLLYDGAAMDARLLTAASCLVTLVALSPGCDDKTTPPKDAAAVRPAAEAKPAPDAKGAPEPDAETKQAVVNPHGAMPPHGGGMGGPAAAKQPGPPRDVTPSGEVERHPIGELHLDVPKEWEKGATSSPMRVAEFVLPGPGGDAELVVFRFKGGAGGVEANVERWKGMFQPPEGKSIDDITKTGTLEVGDLDVTTVDISGRYVAAVRPGADETLDEADYRMLAAIIEGSGDPFFLKGTGPQKTLDVWADAFTTMLQSVAK
jgi:hypothetical protein